MPPTLADRVGHILAAINTIQTGLANKPLEQFTDDLLLRLAVERSFEIISEASRRLPENMKAQQQSIDWQGMADLGNVLRQAYHRVDARRLWEIAERDLPPLKAFAERVMGEPEQGRR